MSRISCRAILVVLAGMTILAGTSSGCDETVTVNDVGYTVPNLWCQKKLADSARADPAMLVRLPKKHSFGDYRIYVTRATREAFVSMAAAALEDSILLVVSSGYRSAGYQEQIIARRMTAGKTFQEATRYVAPPGYSEHETGRAVDFTAGDANFAQTKTYAWLKQNAGRFRFAESYPEQSVDSLPWEPWHWIFTPSAE